MPPAPKVVIVDEDAALLGAPEDAEVAAGREAYGLLRQEAASLAQEVGGPHFCPSGFIGDLYYHFRLQVSEKSTTGSMAHIQSAGDGGLAMKGSCSISIVLFRAGGLRFRLQVV